ncbi:MAG: CHAT domain-containing protein [Anaerolineae bacterium]|nr:CHAT domain-containing protein [Anaerolineae bacterium]
MDIKLTVTVENRTRAIAERSGAPAPVSGKVFFERDSLEHQTLMLFRRWMERDLFTERRDVEVFGRHLYRVIFGDQMLGREFERALEDAARAAPPARLRIHLRFEPDAAELAGLPWEYLYFPGASHATGQFVCEGADLILSRYLPTDDSVSVPGPVDGRKIRVLVAVASPRDEKLPAVLHMPVVQFLERLGESLPIELHVLENATVDAFQTAMDKARPDVLHFMGHGQFNYKENQGEVAFLDGAGSPEWCADYNFVRYATRLKEGSAPRLVILHLCEGGKIDLRESFAGMAPNLIRSGVQAVVAMQYTVKNRAAIDFSAAFYEELLQNRRPVDYAVQKGRMALARQREARLFATPVLYVFTTDTINLTPEAAAAPRNAISAFEQPPDLSADQRQLAAAYFSAVRAIRSAGLNEAQVATLLNRLDALRGTLLTMDAAARQGALQWTFFNESDATFKKALYAMLEVLP